MQLELKIYSAARDHWFWSAYNQRCKQGVGIVHGQKPGQKKKKKRFVLSDFKWGFY